MDYSTLEAEIKRISLPFLKSLGFKIRKESRGNIELETQHTVIKLHAHYSLPGLEIYFGSKENGDHELFFNDVLQLLNLSVFPNSTEEYLHEINSIIDKHKDLLVDNEDFYHRALLWKNQRNVDYNLKMQMGFAISKADAYWQKGEYSLFLSELAAYKSTLSNSYLKKIAIAEKKMYSH